MKNQFTLKRWVKALRSGRYKQTREKLGSLENGFCCLGLACHIKKIKFYEETSYPPNENIRLKTLFGVRFKYSMRTLVAMNDGGNSYLEHSFKEIADVLEGKMEPKKTGILIK